MNSRFSTLAAAAIVALGFFAASADAGHIYSVGYTDQPQGVTTDFSAAEILDWVKWGNGEAPGSPTYATPEKVGGTIINPKLTPLGSVPPGQTVGLYPFPPVQNNPPLFSWTDGTLPMANGQPVGTSVSEAISPAQFSYPLGLGLSFEAEADAGARLLKVYVFGFDARSKLTATLSGGAQAELIAMNATLIPVPTAGGDNYVSFGYFSVLYDGPGETLTLKLTADNQSGIPTNAPQYGFRNSGSFGASVEAAMAPVPEPSSLFLSAFGLAAMIGVGARRRRRTV